MELREIQSVAKSRGLHAGKIDGLWGPMTKAACVALILEQRVDPRAWPQRRLTIGAGQAICRSLGIDAGLVDGYRGPQTVFAFEVHAARKASGALLVPSVETWRDEPALTAKPPAAATAWPTQAGMERFFGPVGSNQIIITLPYEMRLAWDLKTTVTRMSCHRLVAPAIRRVFERTLAHYGFDHVKRLRLDRFGGCLNVRRMRGGASWSTHAWGAAIDLDPERNALNTKAPAAAFSGKAYDLFWRFVEAEGFVSLGRARNYDWMHFQAARL